MSTLKIPGLESLWQKTLGDSRICVAVLDGTVDTSHPCLHGARLKGIQTLISSIANRGTATQHGTHVTSVIFGQHGSSVPGIAPGCRGLIVPIFSDGRGDKPVPCSQVDLARAITQAVENGANIINISGGQLTASPESDRLLANAIRLCREKNVLIVAATGNDGCECLHLPAALESVLAVGAMDSQGNPLDFSNWGKVYRDRGILALGENILGATPDGGTALRTGTSFATPLVSGIVALLLSIQLQQGKTPDPHGIREILLKSALPCGRQNRDNRRCLAGTLNLIGAYTLITQGETQPMSDQIIEETMIQPSEMNAISPELTNAIDNNSIEQLTPLPVLDLGLQRSVPRSGAGLQAAEALPSVSPVMSSRDTRTADAISPSACACGGGGGAPQLVYALGELDTDFGTEARRDSFLQAMPQGMSLLDYLAQNPYEAQSLIWILKLDATPIYAIAPIGAYASLTFDRLRSYLADANIERISVPGTIGGSIRLMSGQVVPVIIPEVRGMYSWSVPDLMEAVMSQINAANVTEEGMRSQMEDYLNRIYYDFRNLGVTPQERALNFSATNAFQVAAAIARAAGSQRVLDSISVEKSPICRPDSDCYDVKLSFFDPEHKERSKRVFRFTVDVSDVIPVTVGRMRTWSQS
ncbi:PatA/PatG family cyanobactin maturation protease [Pannus brasiliensis CCIBt3594]|uniref:PatA/PatG family cyanobactin maturation protease n=1 Tax=Pannus brasiliensis CCIBt3594 TaxID=1427578 RepID=A0AAW9QXE2_9CHRO